MMIVGEGGAQAGERDGEYGSCPAQEQRTNADATAPKRIDK